MSYHNKIIEEVLHRYQSSIGKDRLKYRNHVYRVYLNCLLLDGDSLNHEKYAYAAAFHDIGIWTNNTIDYLQPSIATACEYLANHGKKEWVGEITLMIYWHHKISAYKGGSQQLVEVFRKADWIDVSLGILSFGAARKEIRKVRKILPNLGFHIFLLKKIVKNLFVHPLKPLPMFRK